MYRVGINNVSIDILISTEYKTDCPDKEILNHISFMACIEAILISIYGHRDFSLSFLPSDEICEISLHDCPMCICNYNGRCNATGEFECPSRYFKNKVILQARGISCDDEKYILNEFKRFKAAIDCFYNMDSSDIKIDEVKSEV